MQTLPPPRCHAGLLRETKNGDAQAPTWAFPSSRGTEWTLGQKQGPENSEACTEGAGLVAAHACGCRTRAEPQASPPAPLGQELQFTAQAEVSQRNTPAMAGFNLALPARQTANWTLGSRQPCQRVSLSALGQQQATAPQFSSFVKWAPTSAFVPRSREDWTESARVWVKPAPLQCPGKDVPEGLV